MNWSFFQRVVCLTLGPDWPIACAEFERVRLENVWRFDALPIDNDKILGPHQSFSASVRQILNDFITSGATTLLHLEDDVAFQNLDHLESALNELPDDWDIVYLGANIQCDPERYSEHLFRVNNCWTTHAIGYNRKCVSYLLENQPPFSETMFDTYLGQQLARLNAFVVAPMVAYQRPHVSSIWGRYDDYTPIFEASDERLK